MNQKEYVGESVSITIDIETCKGHGECVDSCPSSVYELQEGKAVPVDINACIECCTCVSVCPEEAIEHSSC